MRRKEGLILKLGQLIEFQIKKIFMEKYPENVNQKLIPDPFLIYVIDRKQLLHTSNSFENRIIRQNLRKNLKKLP